MFLVGRLYKCSIEGDYLRSSDVELIKQCVPHSSDIVFTRKTSSMILFLDMIFEFVGNGLSFPKIERILRSRIENECMVSQEKYKFDCIAGGVSSDDETVDAIKEQICKWSPTSSMLEDLFKAWFRQNEEMFKECMRELNAGVITIDHTFKVRAISVKYFAKSMRPTYEIYFLMRRILLKSQSRLLD